MSFLSHLPGFEQILAVLVGGAIGSTLRFILGYVVGNAWGANFPWATLLVNTAGSFILAYLGALLILKPLAIDPNLRLLLTTGFAGGFTTFSTFTYETMMLYQKHEFDLAALNVVFNFILGFLAAFWGIVMARLT